MAWIFERYTLSKRLQLGREEVLRPLPMGTDWQKLRLGVRWCANDGAIQTIAGGNWGVGLYLGVAQGASTSFLADTVTDWIGGGYVGSTASPNGSGSLLSGTPNYWQMSGGNPNGVHKSGSTCTFGSASSVVWYMTGSGAGGGYGGHYFSGMYIDITKGAGSYTVDVGYVGSLALAQTNVTDAVFLTNMETSAAPTGVSMPSKTVVYTGNGLFDHLSLVWTRSYPSIEISGLAATRIL